MVVKENNYSTFNNYYRKAEQLFAEGKLIPKKMLTYKCGSWIVAHKLALYSNNPPYWQTNDKEILVSKDRNEDTVAHLLALYHPTWVTNDPDILYLKGSWNKTIKEVLVKRIMDGEKKDGS